LRNFSIVDTRKALAPDGGWGWVISVATCLLCFIAEGTGYSFGVFLEYYTESFDTSVRSTSFASALFYGVYSTACMYLLYILYILTLYILYILTLYPVCTYSISCMYLQLATLIWFEVVSPLNIIYKTHLHTTNKLVSVELAFIYTQFFVFGLQLI